MNQRAVPRFIYPTAVEDVQRAVRFIRYHAEKYGISPNRIRAIDGSSGGHLVSMLGVLEGNESLADDTPINRMSAKVQCVIARAAPTNFIGGGIGESFIGVRGKEIKDSSSAEFKRALEASPISHVSEDDPPFLFVHGDKDEREPFSLSVNMYEKFQEKRIATKLIKMEGAGHGARFPGAINPPDLHLKYVKWMDTYLIEN